MERNCLKQTKAGWKEERKSRSRLSMWKILLMWNLWRLCTTSIYRNGRFICIRYRVCSVIIETKFYVHLSFVSCSPIAIGDLFYLRPKQKWTCASEIWFEAQPIGKNTLDKRVKEMCCKTCKEYLYLYTFKM